MLYLKNQKQINKNILNASPEAVFQSMYLTLPILSKMHSHVRDKNQ